MTDSDLEKMFFDRNELNKLKIEKMTDSALHNCDDGELFLEQSHSESFSFDDNTLKNSSYSTTAGFGMRCVLGDRSAYAHSTIFSEDSIQKACKTASAIKDGYQGTTKLFMPDKNHNSRNLYISENPLNGAKFEDKINLLKKINDYLRSKNNLVKQVSASLSGSLQSVAILRSKDDIKYDVRPLVRLNISVMVEKNNRMESGSNGSGGRILYDNFFKDEYWQNAADQALRQALVNLEAVPGPAGQVPIILGNGWPGILLHEAVGHGLEGDFNRKKTSAFAKLLGKQVAAKGVTVIDDGTLENRRGSLNIDDEGTVTQKNILIEDGILKAYMQDRTNARLMNVAPTGNGRRESFEYQPLPRMTNTYMLSGKYDPQEIIASVKDGIYAVNFGGGQVDITSGKFVFSMSEAYLVKNGKIAEPIKGATLIGNGPDVLTKIKMLGNDTKLDSGIGTCGKSGQGVPVGVGQPTMLIEGITVGGTSE